MQSQWELLFIENIKKICKPFQLRHQTTFKRLKKIDEKTDNRAMNERINEWMNEGIDDESIQNTYSTGWKCHRYFVYNLIIFEAEKSQMKWINITNIINKGGKKLEYPSFANVLCVCECMHRELRCTGWIIKWSCDVNGFGYFRTIFDWISVSVTERLFEFR